jgi:hypothetical protein
MSGLGKHDPGEPDEPGGLAWLTDDDALMELLAAAFRARGLLPEPQPSETADDGVDGHRIAAPGDARRRYLRRHIVVAMTRMDWRRRGRLTPSVRQRLRRHCSVVGRE